MANLPSQISGKSSPFICAPGTFRKCEDLLSTFIIVKNYKTFGPVYLYSENKKQWSVSWCLTFWVLELDTFGVGTGSAI